MSWLAAVVIGLVVGVLVQLVIRGGESPALSAVVGLIGAVLGRHFLSHSLKWHPHALAAVIGALVLSLLWCLAVRGPKGEKSAPPAKDE